MPFCYFVNFFLLDQKEAKSQDKPDPSGRFVGPFRARVLIVLSTLFYRL